MDDASRPPGRRLGRAQVFPSGDAGFTLIELMVGLILISIFSALIMRPFLNQLTGATKVQTAANAQLEVSRAVEAIRQDIADARAPHRTASRIRSVTVLEEALAGTPKLSSDPTDPAGMVLDVRDVLVAAPDRIRVRADVVTGGQTECVDYTGTRSGGTYRLERTVYATPACGGAVLQRRNVIRRLPINSRTPPATFTYRLISRPTYGTCTAVQRASATGTAMNWISEVGVSVQAVDAQGDQASERTSTTWVSLRSRETSEYRRAVGCG